MTCKEIEDLLPGMIDGALPEAEKKAIEAHLATCASCGKALADLRTSDARVKSLEDVEPPVWLKTTVTARRFAKLQEFGLIPSGLDSAVAEVMQTGHVGAEYVEYVLRHKRGLTPQPAPLLLGNDELD
ncbi:MAG: hypothetical protein HGA73_03615, partial [Syntrophaceae bacterium]|nr:hypothetical protein [Syntrophaceae bacterium]